MARSTESQQPEIQESKVYEINLGNHPSKIIATAPDGYRVEINITRELNKLNVVHKTERFVPTKSQMRRIEMFRSAAKSSLQASLRYQETIQPEPPSGDVYSSEAVLPDLVRTTPNRAYYNQIKDLMEEGIPSWILQEIVRGARFTTARGETHIGEARPEVMEKVTQMQDRIDRIYGEGKYAPK